MTYRLSLLVLPSLVLALAASLQAQQPSGAAPASPALPMPAVGDAAPDFTFLGATRYGLLAQPSRLSDYRGQTVILWLFIKARTRG